MNSINATVVNKARDYVLELFSKRLPGELKFHSPEHTLGVLQNAINIGKADNYSISEIDILSISALFHDVGYLYTYDEHEKASAARAREFLSGLNIDEEEIQKVERAIMATKVPQKPVDRISEALCDADMMHLTFDDYFERMENLRLEWKYTGRADLSEYDFHKQSADFFGRHKFHTVYGKNVLAPKKNLILKRIEAIISK